MEVRLTADTTPVQFTELAVTIPLHVMLSAAVTAPMQELPDTPIPPETTRAPVVFDDDASPRGNDTQLPRRVDWY